MVVTKVVMPKLGLLMTEGRIVQWFKKEGERIEKGELLFELETEKLVEEVEARGSGVLRKILVQEGDIVPVSETIGIIAEPDEELPTDLRAPTNIEAPEIKEIKKAVSPEPTGRIRISPVARKLANESGIDVTNIVGTGPGGRIVKADVLSAV